MKPAPALNSMAIIETARSRGRLISVSRMRVSRVAVPDCMACERKRPIVGITVVTTAGPPWPVNSVVSMTTAEASPPASSNERKSPASCDVERPTETNRKQASNGGTTAPMSNNVPTTVHTDSALPSSADRPTSSAEPATSRPNKATIAASTAPKRT